MIHGATIRRARAIRTTIETATIAVSHTQAGTASARDLSPAPGPSIVSALSRAAMPSRDDPGLARPRRQLADVLDPDVRRGLRDPPENRVVHRVRAGGLLERDRVGV